MGVAKFTPGPWICEGVYVVPVANGDSDIDRTMGVAKVMRFDGERSKDIADANAQLIASAPKLYEAGLRALVEMASISVKPQTFLDAMADLEKAIREARGESQ